LLPLHAAGDYNDNQPGSKVFECVISSYTPTLSALLVAPQSTEFRGILAVGQAGIGGPAALPATIQELDRIESHAGSLGFTRLDEARATPTAVLDAMETHSWVHLACHGEQNTSDPMQSAFRLNGGTLDLGSIAKKQLKCADFAFLSACQTASGHKVLENEAIHLAAGMLLAGYRTVVATMWSINDADAPLIAATVYTHLLEGGVPNSTKAAKALHIAVQSLRDKIGEKNFVAWVPFIHMGL
jgi:CHAT domain-containing protein